VLSPALMAAVALAVHQLLPNRQELPLGLSKELREGLGPYPLVLKMVLGAALALAAAQAAWRPLRRWARHYAPLLAGLLFLFTLWDLVTLKMSWLRMPFFPGPDMVLSGMVQDHEELLRSTWYSLQLLLCGYTAGVTAGLVTGILIGWFPRVRYWALPFLKLVGPVPATVLVALAMTLFTSSFKSGVALIGFAVWFPMTMLTSSGIANVRVAYLDVARTLGAGRLYLIFRVAVPAALPNIFLGLFIGLTVSFLTLATAEAVGVKAGLGYYINWQLGYLEYAKVYAALMIVAAFCSTLMTVLFKVRDRVLKWQKGVIRW
jgi:NitT/TauT family transport system permease protein